MLPHIRTSASRGPTDKGRHDENRVKQRNEKGIIMPGSGRFSDLHICGIDAQGEESSPPTSEKEDQEAKSPEALAPTPGLLMSLLGKAGLAKPLDWAGINIYGYVEGGYMHDFTAPGRHDGPTFIGFNSYKNAATLDKISLIRTSRSTPGSSGITTPPTASPTGRPSAPTITRRRWGWLSNRSQRTSSSRSCCSHRNFATTTLTMRFSTRATEISGHSVWTPSSPFRIAVAFCTILWGPNRTDEAKVEGDKAYTRIQDSPVSAHFLGY